MRIALLLSILLPATASLHAQVIKRDYHGFTLWIDCAKRGPIMFEYRLGADTGDFKRGRGVAEGYEK